MHYGYRTAYDTVTLSLPIGYSNELNIYCRENSLQFRDVGDKLPWYNAHLA